MVAGDKLITDVCILTVTPMELHALLKGLNVSVKAPGEKLNSGSFYWRCSVWSRRCKRRLGTVVGCIARAGNPDAAAATTEFIDAFNPSFMMLCGIAAGIRGRIKIGNVVLSTHVVSYEPGVVRRKSGDQLIDHRPEIVPVHQAVSQDIAAYLASHSNPMPTFQKVHGRFVAALNEHQKEFDRHVAAKVEARAGVIASGELLLRDSQFLRRLRKNIHEKIEVGEMEASGFVGACSRHQVPWLVVRGISDFGDNLKDDRFHLFSAAAATAVTVDFLRRGLHVSRPDLARKDNRQLSSIQSRKLLPSREVLLSLDFLNYSDLRKLRAGAVSHGSLNPMMVNILKGYTITLALPAQLFCQQNKWSYRDLVRKVAAEIYGHRPFLLLDYKSITIPLPGGVCVITTKEDREIRVENCVKVTISPEIIRYWNEAIAVYFSATEAPWRFARRPALTAQVISNVVRSEVHPFHPQKIAERLLSAVGKYLAHLDPHNDAKLILSARELFASMKAHFESFCNAIDEFLHAGTTTVRGVSKIVLDYEIMVSSAHKILLDGAPPSKAL
jgi:nucleoside phosphorylase